MNKLKMINYYNYINASKERINDLSNFTIDNDSIITMAYISGVSVECLLRAHIVKNTNKFDAKHDLTKLLIDSKILDNLNQETRVELSTLVRKLNTKWNNNFRYNSIIKAKRDLSHQLARVNRHHVQNEIYNYFKDIIEKSKMIIELGERHGLNK